jgi:PAS domain S-box-containing protein
MPDKRRKDDVQDSHTLRQRAEASLRKTPQDVTSMSGQDVQRLVHELQVYQIELEMQNEELRRSQQELEASRDQYYDLYDFAPIGYLLLDVNGVILEANLTAARLLSVDRAHMLRKRLAHFILPADQDILYLHGQQVLREQTTQTCEPRMQRQDNTTFFARLESIVWPEREGKQRQWRMALIDISATKHAEEALQHAEAQMQQQREALHQREKLSAMGVLLANVAHELNNPLTVVMIEAELLAEETAQEPQAARAMQIRQAAQRCEHLVHNFLKLARQHPLERRSVQLNTLVQDTLALLMPAMRTDDIQVHLHLATDLPTLWADDHQLQQVVMNLVTNAHQALRTTSAPRMLTLTTQADPTQTRVTLEVADTGPGIPSEIRARIFEPFFTTKTQEQGGTGLGLSLCRGIVEGHRGTLAVQSQSGHGTTFLVSLPVTVGSVAELPETAALPPAQPQQAGRAILIVDDEVIIAKTLASLLRRTGYTVDTAANGWLALAKLQEQTFDLILCDLRMPELDGPALYRELERHYPHLRRRIVFITGDTLSPESSSFLERTKATRLTKPFGATSVRQAVEQALQAL